MNEHDFLFLKPYVELEMLFFYFDVFWVLSYSIHTKQT